MSRMKLDPLETAMYRFCKEIVKEFNAWKEHEETYTDNMKALQAQVIEELNLSIQDKGDIIRVSYELKKE